MSLKEKVSLMIDIETLGTATDAVILSIGIVPFEPKPDGEIYESKGRQIFVTPDSQKSRSVTTGTVGWWLRQSSDAQKRMANGMDRAVSLTYALEMLDTAPMYFFNCHRDYHPLSSTDENRGWNRIDQVWANGTTFDISNLATAYESQGRVPIWAKDGGFRKVRCQRTLTGALGDVEQDLLRLNVSQWAEERTMKLVPHDAVDDCIYQCKVIQEANRLLRQYREPA
jgi:hypothetical protein